MTSNLGSERQCSPSRTTCRGPAVSQSGGYGLLEVVVAIFLSGLLFSIAFPACLHLLSVERLFNTSETLAYQLRYVQQLAQTMGSYGQVRLSLYTPEYSTYLGTRRLNHVYFEPMVNYKDGYLQMQTGTITYDLLGNAAVAGSVRLVSSNHEDDVNLYLGSGWQSVVW